MSEQADLLGIPETFLFEGRTYQVSERTLEHEALFSRWVAAEARALIARHADEMSPLEYEAQLAGWRQDGAAHAYDFDGFVCQRALHSPSGSRYIAFLALKKHDKDGAVTMQLVDRIYADAAAWQELQSIMRRLNNPNAQRGPRQEKATP
jgi:hypothetical protein